MTFRLASLLLFWILLMQFFLSMACQKEDYSIPQPVVPQDSLDTLSLYVHDVKGLPVPGADINLNKYDGILPSFPFHYLGKTDSMGRLLWTYDSVYMASVLQPLEFVVSKSGYFTRRQLAQKPLELNDSFLLNRAARLLYHVTYQNDSTPKQFFAYVRWVAPPQHNNPGGYSYNTFLVSPKVNKIDTAFTIELSYSVATMEISAYSLDTFMYNSGGYYYYESNFPRRIYTLPAGARDTTFVIEDFW